MTPAPRQPGGPPWHIPAPTHRGFGLAADPGCDPGRGAPANTAAAGTKLLLPASARHRPRPDRSCPGLSAAPQPQGSAFSSQHGAGTAVTPHEPAPKGSEMWRWGTGGRRGEQRQGWGVEAISGGSLAACFVPYLGETNGGKAPRRPGSPGPGLEAVREAIPDGADGVQGLNIPGDTGTRCQGPARGARGARVPCGTPSCCRSLLDRALQNDPDQIFQSTGGQPLSSTGKELFY